MLNKQIEVSIALLWSIENSATMSEGYGGWLSRAILELEQGQKPDLFEDQVKIAEAVYQFLNETTPQIVDLSDLPDTVKVTQRRSITSQTLTINVTVYDKSGDSRSERYVLQVGDPRSSEDIQNDILSMFL